MYSFLDIIYVKKGVYKIEQTLCNVECMARKSIAGTGVNPGGGGGWEMYPPLFWVGGWPVQISPPPPPLFEDKITLNLTFIVKKLTF